MKDSYIGSDFIADNRIHSASLKQEWILNMEFRDYKLLKGLVDQVLDWHY